jgi:hypothetical protein
MSNILSILYQFEVDFAEAAEGVAVAHSMLRFKAMEAGSTGSEEAKYFILELGDRDDVEVSLKILR